MSDKVSIEFGGEAANFLSAVKTVNAQIEGLTGPLKEVQEQCIACGEALATAFAIEKLEKAVEKMAELGETALKMSAILGQSVEQFSAFSNMLAGFGISSDEAGHTLERLERNMAEATKGSGPAAAAFQALGFSIDQVKSGQEDVPGFLDQLRQKWQEYRDDGNKTAAFQAILGRAFDQLIPYFQKTDEELAEMKERMAETGAELTGGMAEGMERTGENLHVMGASFQGIAITLFEAFKPAVDAVINGLTDFVESCNNALKGTGILHDALTAIVIVVDVVVGVIATMSAAINIFWQGIEVAVQDVVVSFQVLGTVIQDVLGGHWAKIGGDVDAGLAKIEKTVDQRRANILAATEEWKKTIDRLFSNIGETGVDTGGGAAAEREQPSKRVTPLGELDSGRAATLLQQWRDELDQKLIAEKNFFQDSKNEELLFWQAKLALTSEGSQEQLAVRRNIYTLQRDMARQARTEQQAIERADADADLQISKIRLQQHRDELDAEVAAGKISADEKLETLKVLANQEYVLDVQRLAQEMGMLEQGTAAWQKVYDQLRVLKEKHVADMAVLNRQEQQQQLAVIQSWTAPFKNAITSMTQGFLQGTLTWQQLAARGAQSIAVSYLGHFATIAEDWFDKHVVMAAVDALFGTQVESTAMTAAIAAIAASKVQGFGVVQTDAVMAAAGAYAATAAIPIVGPGLAPAAAAEAQAAVMAMAAGLAVPSAAGGWMVPDDMLAMVHKDERVLPAEYSSGLDALVKGAANGQAPGGSPVNVTFQVSAVDGPSVLAFFNRNAKQIATTISRYMTDNPSARGAY